MPGTLLQCLCSYRFLYCNLLYVFSLMCCITGFFITTYFMFFHLRVVLHVSLLQPTLCFFTSVLCYRFLYYNLLYVFSLMCCVTGFFITTFVFVLLFTYMLCTSYKQLKNECKTDLILKEIQNQVHGFLEAKAATGSIFNSIINIQVKH